MKLSPKQRGFLKEISERVMEGFEHNMPMLYVPHWSRYEYFTSWAELKRWLLNMEDRGLITIENDHFARITKLGLEQIK